MSFLGRMAFYWTASMGLPILWYQLGLYNVDKVKDKSFAKGLRLSERFKKYPAWDKIVEPFIIRQSTVIFIAGHSFIEGLTSDNPPSQHIEKELQKMDTEIDKIVHQKH